MSYVKHKSEESQEDYLENILILSRQLSHVRSIDIANKMSFSKPSVSVAIKNLESEGYIEVSDKGYITLTAAGEELATSVYERHTIISNWLMDMGVDEETAVNDACMMEHDISPKSFEAIKNHIQNLS